MTSLTFTDKIFDKEVLRSQIPVLVDLWAPWCAPCRIVSPIIEELSNEYEGKLRVGKINVDENSETPAKYSVMSIPSIFIFKNGKPIKTMVGAQSKDSYKKSEERIKRLLKR